eukprot:c1739_g1_i1 orf=1-204(-)
MALKNHSLPASYQPLSAYFHDVEAHLVMVLKGSNLSMPSTHAMYAPSTPSKDNRGPLSLCNPCANPSE